jgi:hAT family C-terminal dimerisation region
LADEIARYLSAPTEATLDPLLWWTERKDIYPRLSRMALDYLSIPGEFIFCPNIPSEGSVQLPLLMSNVSSVKVDFFFLMFVIGFL